ncbi:MAG: hypothetical protein ACOC6Q_01630 [Patescibacteria group bacterium]
MNIAKNMQGKLNLFITLPSKLVPVLLVVVGMGFTSSFLTKQVMAESSVVADNSDVLRAANITQEDTEYYDNTGAQPGEAIQLLGMVHLGQENSKAEDVSVQMDLDHKRVQRSDGKYELIVKATIDSSTETVEDTTKIIVPSKQELVFIPEHEVILTTHGNLPSKVPEQTYTWPDSDELFGEGLNLGDIEGVSTVYISLKAYVSNKTANMSIEKQVTSVDSKDGEWHSELKVEPGEQVKYQIVVRNTGGSELNDILITDQLPDQLQYISGSSVYSTPYSDGFKKLADSWITGEDGVSHANLGKLPVGKGYNAIIVFKAQVKDSIENVKIKNAAQAKANEYPDWIYDQAVLTVAEQEEELYTDLQLSKYVRFVDSDRWYSTLEADKYTFSESESVQYYLEVKNTGSKEAKNVEVIDHLPELLSWVGGEGHWDEDLREVEFALGTIAAGDSVEKYYTAKTAENLSESVIRQENVATLYEGEDKVQEDKAVVYVQGEGEVLAEEPSEEPEVLPVSGAQVVGLRLLSLLAISVGLFLKKYSALKI